ncbi:MAG: aminotransferase class V-fold PLP-dependent enzyme [Planctomycetota bacterium]
MPDLETIRRDFPVLEKVAFLASAGFAPMPAPAAEGIRRYLDDVYVRFDWDAIEEDVYGACRKAAARFIHADPDEVALVKSTTEGVNAFASSVPWSPGDKILLNDMEYPANVIPWVHQAHRHGLEIQVVPSTKGEVPAERMLEAIDERTRVVAVSHVEFANGFKHDLRALADAAHAKGAYCFVDAIQSLGAMEVDVGALGIDGLTAGGYKWLCGPVGTGFAYFRKEGIPGLRPGYAGFESLEAVEQKALWDRAVRGEPYVGDFKALSDTATRFEYGSLGSLPFKGLEGSLAYFQALGMGWIESRIARLTAFLRERLEAEGYEIMSPREPEKRGGIVLFRPKVDVRDREAREGVVQRLREARVYVHVRCGGIRVSCHFFNSEEDLERLLHAVASLA